MSFDIRDGVTTVTSEMTVEPNPNVEEALRKGYLVLNGEEEAVKLLSLQLHGKDLEHDEADKGRICMNRRGKVR